MRGALGPDAGSLDVVRRLAGAARPAKLADLLRGYGAPVQHTEKIITQAAVGGGYTVHLHPRDGVSWSGRVVAGGLTSHDFTLRVTVDYPFIDARGEVARASLVLIQSGEVSGSLESGSDTFRWAEPPLPVAASVAGWAGLRHARIARRFDYDSDLGFVGDALEWVAKLVIASATLGSVGAGLVLSSTAASTLRLDELVAPGLVGVIAAAGGYFALGPAMVVPLFAAGSTAYAATDIQRPLRPSERAVIDQVFGSRFPADRVLINAFPGVGGRPFVMPTHGDTILVNAGGDRFTDYLGKDPGNFVHEMTHVWQIHNTSFSPLYYCRSWATAAHSAAGKDIADDIYEPGSPGKRWSDYGVEAQCTIVERWYTGGRREDDPWYPYIVDHIRRGRD